MRDVLLTPNDRDQDARAPARARDHRRDSALAVAGYRVHRFTWSQVTRERGAVARTVRALLAPRGA